MGKTKLKFFISLSFLAFITSLLLPSIVFGQQSSEIYVSRTPFLSFVDTPDSINFGTTSTPIATTSLFSDTGVSLENSRLLQISDTRDCGGFNLQVEAAAFSPGGTNAVSNGNLYVVSSSSLASPPAGTEINNIIYVNGFSGDQNTIAPVNTTFSATCTSFNQIETFTDPTCMAGTNTLNAPVDILQGSLTAPSGRDGDMAVGTSFLLQINPFTIPAQYTSTITYTLTDATTGICP